MLVLTRRQHERVVIPAVQTRIEVTAIRPGLVRLGVEAPQELTVLREEVYLRGEAVPCRLPEAAGAEARLVRLEALLRQRLRTMMQTASLARRQALEGPAHAPAALSLLEDEVRDLCREARAIFGRQAPGDGADLCAAVPAE
jgi:carbon storage regulator CsrA